MHYVKYNMKWPTIIISITTTNKTVHKMCAYSMPGIFPQSFKYMI